MSDKKEESHSDKIKRPLVKILLPVKKLTGRITN
jgi:hypothetical protein